MIEAASWSLETGEGEGGGELAVKKKKRRGPSQKDLVIKQLQDQLHALQRQLSGSNNSTITIDAIAQKGSKDKTRGFAGAASLAGTPLAPQAYGRGSSSAAKPPSVQAGPPPPPPLQSRSSKMPPRSSGQGGRDKRAEDMSKADEAPRAATKSRDPLGHLNKKK